MLLSANAPGARHCDSENIEQLLEDTRGGGSRALLDPGPEPAQPEDRTAECYRKYWSGLVPAAGPPAQAPILLCHQLISLRSAHAALRSRHRSRKHPLACSSPPRCAHRATCAAALARLDRAFRRLALSPRWHSSLFVARHPACPTHIRPPQELSVQRCLEPFHSLAGVTRNWRVCSGVCKRIAAPWCALLTFVCEQKTGAERSGTRGCFGSL